MSFQRIHQVRSRNSHTPWHFSQLAPRPFPAEETNHTPTPKELEEQTFHENRAETARLQPNLLEILIRNAQTTTVPQPLASVQPKRIENQQRQAVSTTASPLWVQPKLTIVQPDHDRSVSNESMTGLVQRQDADAPNLLSSGQAAQAVSFYKSKPDLYPPDVIKKIQQAVKSPETGIADAAMAQGVARFQEVTVLKVDGMAGPRTLPRLFQSGLATDSDRQKFVAAGKAVAADWVKLSTPKARAEKLFEGIKARLDDQKIPTPKMVLGSLNKAAGLFKPTDWTIIFDQAALSPASISDDDTRDLSGTFYHEARHVEQSHKMARMLATKGNTAEQIKTKMQIPIEIAQDAFNNKLPRDIEFATAAQQFDSIYGSGKAHFAKTEAEAPSTAELRAAQAAAAADPSPANKAKAARLLAAYKAYHDLPTENDAFATEVDFEASWDEATATP
jgi:peptidoglycan hydrolase-like protein with peptidoglycan-binding domain